MAVQGTWTAPGILGSLGVKIPDFGLTEKYAPWLGRNPNQPGQSMTFPTTSNNGQLQGVPVNSVNNPPPPYTPPSYTPQGQVKGITTTGGGTGGGTPGQSVIDQNANAQNDQLNQDYENTMTMLGGQEQQAQGQAAAATGTLGAEQTQVTNQLANQQTVDTQGQEAQLATGEKTAATGMQGARDLFRQTQQNNIAQLSGAGLSSSSVAEALAERLGVETARRIAGITGSIGEIRQNATKEMARIKSYYEGKATEATQWVSNEKINIQNNLNSQLNQINNAKNQAAQAKSSARASLLADVRTQLFTLQQQENTFQNSLKQWATQKASALQTLNVDPAANAAYNSSISNMNSAPGITQTSIGNYGINDQGQQGFYPGQVKSVAKPKEDLSTSGGAMFGVQPDYNKFPNDGFTN